jgi:hypothetical protein
VECGYVWACLLDEPRDISQVAVMSSSYRLYVSIRSRGQDFGLQLHSLEATVVGFNFQTVTERVQTVTERIQTVTGSRLLLRGSKMILILRGYCN